MIEIKLVDKALLSSLAALEKAVFPFPWSEEALALLTGDTAFGFAAVEGDRVLSYGGVTTVLDEGQVTNIATLPEFRRVGLASRVLDAIIAEAKKRRLSVLFLEVRQSNLAARQLYEKFGFSVVGCRKGFYHHPREDALLMRKEFGKAPLA